MGWGHKETRGGTYFIVNIFLGSAKGYFEEHLHRVRQGALGINLWN
jgi:hypothetical protein